MNLRQSVAFAGVLVCTSVLAWPGPVSPQPVGPAPAPTTIPTTLTELLKAAADKERPTEQRVEAVQEIIRSEATRHVMDASFRGTHFDAQQVVPVLLQLLKDEAHLVRRSAAEALAWYGPDEQTVPALIAALQDEDDGRPYDGTVASCAADSLGLLGAKAKAAVPALIAATKTRHELLTPSGLRALGEIAAADKALTASRITALPLSFGPLAMALAQIVAEDQTLTSQVVPALVEVFRDKEQKADSRTSAVTALGLLGPVAKDAVSALRQALRDNDVPPPPIGYGREPDYRREILKTLESMGPIASAAVPELIAILQDRGDENYFYEQNNYRAAAIQAMAMMGPAAKELLQLLREIADAPAQKQSDHQLVPVARRALHFLDPNAPDPLPELMKATQSDDAEVRAKALSDLVSASCRQFHLLPKANAEQVVSVLLYALHRDTPKNRSRVANYLQWYGSDERVVPALIANLKKEDKSQPDLWGVTRMSAYSLGLLGDRAAIPVLIEAVDKGDQYLATQAMIALANIARQDRKAAPVVVPILLAVLQDQEQPSSKRDNAANALCSIGLAAKAAVPALLVRLKRDFPPGMGGRSLRSQFVMKLGNIGRGAEAAVPDLVAILQDVNEDWDLRQRAAYALGSIGRAAEPVTPALNMALGDSDHRVREAAERALMNLRR